jgi:hypothetical protein
MSHFGFTSLWAKAAHDNATAMSTVKRTKNAFRGIDILLMSTNASRPDPSPDASVDNRVPEVNGK